MQDGRMEIPTNINVLSLSLNLFSVLYAGFSDLFSGKKCDYRCKVERLVTFISVCERNRFSMFCHILGSSIWEKYFARLGEVLTCVKTEITRT